MATLDHWHEPGMPVTEDLNEINCNDDELELIMMGLHALIENSKENIKAHTPGTNIYELLEGPSINGQMLLDDLIRDKGYDLALER